MSEFLSQCLSARVGKIKPSPTIAVSTRAQELRAAGEDVINLGSGEPDFDTPEHIKAAAVAAIQSGDTKYTAVPGSAALRQSIVNKFARENELVYTPEQIIVSTGAKQALMNLFLAVLDDGDEVLIPAPYWVSYPDMALLADAKPIVIPCDNHFRLTADALRGALTRKTKLVLFNSPSNPSGVLYSAEEWEVFADILDGYPDVVIACDDIYEHIRYDGLPFANLLNIRPDFAERTVIINGVSKAYAMTGWRIGYAAGDATIIKAMSKIQSQSTSNTCSIAQAAAVAALDSGTDCIAPMLQAFDRRRQMVTQGFNDCAGLYCAPINGAFYAFVNASEAIQTAAGKGEIPKADDIDFCSYLLEQAQVAAVPGSAFGADGCFRISFATSDENLSNALARIKKLLAQ